MSDTAPRSGLSDRLTRVFGGLRHVIGEWWGQHRTDDALIHVVWVGLSVRLNRLTSLIERFEAGTLPTPRARAASPVASAAGASETGASETGACQTGACQTGASERGASERGACQAGAGKLAPGEAWAAAVAAVRLPRRKAWLLGKIQPTALYYWELRKLLDDPQMAALLAATPQAGRLLRPLWHMIAPHPMPDILRLPPRPRRPSRQAARASDAEAVATEGSPGAVLAGSVLATPALRVAPRLRRKHAGFARPRAGRFSQA